MKLAEYFFLFCFFFRPSGVPESGRLFGDHQPARGRRNRVEKVSHAGRFEGERHQVSRGGQKVVCPAVGPDVRVDRQAPGGGQGVQVVHQVRGIVVAGYYGFFYTRYARARYRASNAIYG